MAFEDSVFSDGSRAEIYYCVVTGTHSAGKSTMINAFSDPDFSEQYKIGFDDPFSLLPKFSGCALKESNIPIITCEEAMTAYARINRMPKLATEEYSLEHQIAVEAMSHRIVLEGLEIALRLSAVLQPDEVIRRGIIFADRSSMDGLTYSSMRTSEDQENIDFRNVDIKTMGRDNCPGLKNRVWPIRDWNRKFMREYCDLVFIADHTEVSIEDNGFRQTDEEFREVIASKMEEYYYSVLGARALKLSGSSEQRKNFVLTSFIELADNKN